MVVCYVSNIYVCMYCLLHVACVAETILHILMGKYDDFAERSNRIILKASRQKCFYAVRISELMQRVMT